VSTAGEICVNTLKKDWKSSYGIGHILITVKCLLIYPNPESALDEEAGKLLLDNYDSYCERAKLITSVHATPRVRPIEFDSPSSSSAFASSSKLASSSKSAVPMLPLLPMATVPLLNPPLIVPTVIRKSPSPSPSVPPQPLNSSPSNILPISTSASLLSAEKDGKERHTSPSPLGTADANVGPGAGAQPMMTIHPKKAIKRAATGGGTAGTEKRKKALKRL
jgi:ubiquitin-conjugating enzyme E2 S